MAPTRKSKPEEGNSLIVVCLDSFCSTHSLKIHRVCACVFIHPSIFYTVLSNLGSRGAGTTGADNGRRQGTPWTRHQSITLQTQRDRQTHTHIQACHFRVTSYPQMHVFGLWEESIHWKNTHAPHRKALKARPGLELGPWGFGIQHKAAKAFMNQFLISVMLLPHVFMYIMPLS